MENETLHIRYSRGTRITYAVLTLFFLAVAVWLCFFLPYDGSLSLLAWNIFRVVLGILAIFLIFETFMAFFSFFEVNGRSALEHRFLLPDKRFSLDDIDGVRADVRFRAGTKMKLFSKGRRLLVLEKTELESDALWKLFLAQNYPPKLYKGETPQSFAVKTHKSTKLWVVLLCLVIALVGFSTEGPAVVAVAWLIMTAAMFLCFAFERKIYVNGNELKSGRLKMRTAHVSELYYTETVKGLKTVHELRRRDSNERFARLSLEPENCYALLLWLKAHGIDCAELMNMIK